MSGNLLEVKNLKKYFPITGGLLGRKMGNVYAVDDISFNIKEGETVGLVGESGCGKTTLGRTILKLYDPTEGSVIFDGTEISSLSQKEMLKVRRNIQMIFQDPFDSLNSRQTVGEIIEEPMEIYKTGSPEERKKEVRTLLKKVGLSKDSYFKYPHEFSGGQRQRIGIARALALKPKMIICDEPVSALDVSIQSQILNLLIELQKEMNFTYLFIAHDLSVVKHISDRIAVMYLGKIVEYSGADEIYKNPLHPYTKALISAIPIPDPTIKKDKILLEGDIPSPANPPKGCRFHTRCPEAIEICRKVEPELLLNNDVSENHFTACHRVSDEQQE